MKFKLPLSACVLISLALVAFGLVFGTVSGFADERAQANALLHGENGVMDVLDYRGADGLNLCVVASRHLPEGDSEMAALKAAATALRAARDVAVKKTEDEKLESAFAALSAKLSQTPSFQQSQRDQQYLDMLTDDMRNLRTSAAVNTYNQSAAAFNALLDAPVSGALAKLLGVKPLSLYE